MSMATDLEQTSLHEIQSFEKNHKTAIDQFHAVLHILRVPISDFDTHGSIQSWIQGVSVAPGRAEWALRWTLRKLQSPSHGDLDALTALWKLISVLINHLPPAKVGQHLKDHKWLSSVAVTLTKVYNAIQHYLTLTRDKAPNSNVEMRDAGVEEIADSKRKQLYELLLSGRNSSSSSLSQTSSVLLTQVGRCLQAVEDLTAQESRSTDSINHEYLSTALQCDIPTAGHILGLALSISFHSAQRSSKRDSPWFKLGIRPFCSLWMRATARPVLDLSAVVTTFASDILVPCVFNYAALDGHLSTEDEHMKFAEQERRHLLLLLSRDFWEIHRSNFASARHGSHNSVDSGVTDSKGLNAYSNILNLVFYVATTQLQDADRDLVRTAMAALLETCVTSANISSTKTRIEQLSWCQHVFAWLLDITNPQSEPIPSQLHIATVKELLSVVVKHQLRPTAASLHSIVKSHSGLARGDLSMEQWQIISLVLKVDADAIITERLQTSTADQTSNVSTNLMQLIRAISRVTDLTQGSQPEDLFSQQSPRKRLIHDIVSSLIHAFAAARDMGTFVSLWHSEMTRLGEESLETHTSFGSNVWETEQMTVLLGDLLQASLTTTQIQNCISKYQDMIVTPSHHVASASMTVLNAFVYSSMDNVITQLEDVILSTLQANIELLKHSYKEELDVEWKCWQLLTSIIRCLSVVSSRNVLVRVVSRAENLLAKYKLRFAEANTCQLVLLHRLSCLTTLCTTSADRNLALDLTALAQLHIDGIMHIILSQSPRLALSKISILEIIAHSPELLKQTEASLRKRLLSAFLHEAMNDSDVMHFWGLLAVNIANTNIALAKQIGSCVGIALAESLADGSQTPTQKARLSTICARLPKQCMSPYFQTTESQMLMGLLAFPSGQSDQEHKFRTANLNAVRLLAQNQKETGVAVAEFSNLRQIYSNWIKDTHELNSEMMTQDELSMRLIFRTLFEANRKQHAPGGKSWLFEEELWRALSRDTEKKCLKRDGGSRLRKTHVLLQTVLEELSRTPNLDSAAIAQQGHHKSVHTMVENVIRCTSKAEQNHSLLTVILDSINAFDDKILEHHTADLLLAMDRLGSQDLNGLNLALRFRVYCRLEVAGRIPPNFDKALRALGMAESSKAKSKSVIQDALEASITTQGTMPFENFLDITITELYSEPMPPGLWPLLDIFIKSPSLRQTMTNDDKRTSNLVVGMCRQLSMKQGIGAFKDLMSITAKILQHKGFHLSQHAIESVVASMTTLTSPSAPDLPQQDASLIFRRITDIIKALLQARRRALRGRFDVLVLVLQNMLRCLFVSTSGTPSKKAPIQLPQPQWIRPARSDHLVLEAPLGDKDAEAFVRLITIVCEPSVSSVSSKNQSSLVDETAKARAYAGEYMPLVVVELCRCLLLGRISQEVRAQLMRGVYAMLNVISGPDGGLNEGVGKERLEVMGEGLDAAERSVLRSLVTEWRRVGGWKST